MTVVWIVNTNRISPYSVLNDIMADKFNRLLVFILMSHSVYGLVKRRK